MDKQEVFCYRGEHVTLVTSTQLRTQWTHILSISLAFGWRTISGADKMVSAWNRGTFLRIRELKACRFLRGRGGNRGHRTQAVKYINRGCSTEVCSTLQTGEAVGRTTGPLSTFYAPWSFLLGGIKHLLVGNNHNHHLQSFPAAPALPSGNAFCSSMTIIRQNLHALTSLLGSQKTRTTVCDQDIVVQALAHRLLIKLGCMNAWVGK